jgi:hypothetical protein
MCLEEKSLKLKSIVSSYDTKWFLGNLSMLMSFISKGMAEDELGKLSSPLRQLFYLGGLLLTSEDVENGINYHDPKKWDEIVNLLNEIEEEYAITFFPKKGEEIDLSWVKVREVAMPSFLAYFNQGPLNFEEQAICWIKTTFTRLDEIITNEIGLLTEDFINFYESIDLLIKSNLQGFLSPKGKLKDNWEEFTDIEVIKQDGMPDFMDKFHEERKPMMTFVSDHGIINRFYPKELITDKLSIGKIDKIINLLGNKRGDQSFLYYTETKPGNPLYDTPIIDIGNGMFQVFEVKQVLHSINTQLEYICSKTTANETKLVKGKGKELEYKIVRLFSKYLKKDFKLYHSYYVDGCEQDILYLWKNHAFIIESKGYKVKEPFRDPQKAFDRIQRDFKKSIISAYEQTKRIEQKFIDQVPLRIEDKNGKVIDEIDTKRFIDNDYSIIVNIDSYGQIQCDLSIMMKLNEDDEIYPWVVKFDDLETLLLTLTAKNKSPLDFIDYLQIREELHGKVVSSDELEIAGKYINGELSSINLEEDFIILTKPEDAQVFDNQYRIGLGFDNEKHLAEKKSGNTIFI